ncbi:TPA: hypothetical protein DIT45_02845 [Candidatus Acetothermia bacterium]|nr:hypothetical protein [Candidatus Acetothermia bacterium]
MCLFQYHLSKMIIRRCDRYVLREMSGPFLISLFGLLLFILLNLILSLSDLMVDRGVGITTLMRLLLLKMPSLLVLALPVSGLFATFLGLGRLVHDREVMALEAAGISLRRILLPLLVAAFLLGGLDFALYNWAVPFSEHAYQRELRGIIFRQGVPHIQANTFFKGPEGQFFYVRRYDAQDGTLRGILVYDIEGKVFPQAEAAVTILTAETGRWEQRAWDLNEGRVYSYNQKGELIYTGTFEQLHVTVDRSEADFLLRSRTPAEMGIGELRSRITLLRTSGLPAADLIVECHLKAAIPLATLVFVLFGGSTSLIFGWRSRAAGVVISLLLVGLFQGVLLWTQTLGRRGMIPPSLAAWIPNILFGLIGIFLFLRLDRLRYRDLWTRIRHTFPFLGILLLVSLLAWGDEIPVEIECEELFISADRTHVHAQGAVRLSYGETLLSADQVTLDEEEEGSWKLRASEEVHLAIGEDLTLSGDDLSTLLVLEDGSLITRKATAVCFRGKSTFLNSQGEEQLLLYQGKEGRIEFDSNGEVTSIEVREGQLTTCDCYGRALRDQPYSIETGRLLLYPDRLLVAFNLTVSSFGYPVFWLPVYVQPLEETLDSPLFPAIGKSGLRGWFLKWNFPFYLDEENYGAVLFDCFSRFHEVGLGTVLHYAFAVHQGKAKVYYFPAQVGDRVFEVSLDHTTALIDGWGMGGRLAYSQLGEEKNLSFAFSLNGDVDSWRFNLSAERSREEEEEVIYTTERLPGLVISRTRIDIDPFYILPRLEAGWFREWEGKKGGEVSVSESFRFDGSLQTSLRPLSFWGFTLTPTTSLRLTHYGASVESQSREALSCSASLCYPGMDLSYTYLQINGRSPFYFDRLKSVNQISWRFAREGTLSLHVDGGFDLATVTFNPLLITARWSGWSSLTLLTRYDLTTAVVEEISLSGRWNSETNEVSWEVPYEPRVGRFKPVVFEIRGKDETGKLTLTGKVDPGEAKLIEGVLQVELRSEVGWGINLGGRYEQGSQTIMAPSLGLFRDLCDCLRIGIEYKSGQVWLYTSILAFPEAVLRYTPTGAGLKVGQ